MSADITGGRVEAVPLPPGAGRPIRVDVNGEERREGEDFTVDADRVRFSRQLRPRPDLGLGRKIMLAIGIGVYGDLRGDTLDLQYTLGGSTRMVNVPLRAGDHV
ncbi:MAG: hypothetical protein ACLGG9_12210 [Thermoleophilia bacterium]